MAGGNLLDFPEAVYTVISDAVGPLQPDALSSVGGGSINRVYRVTTVAGTHFLLKTNAGSAASMFAAEQDGLNEMRRTGTIRVPEPIVTGGDAHMAFLLLEYIEFGPPTAGAAADCGHALAAMHRSTQPRFGWYRDNTIGSTPQPNGWTDDWTTFVRDARLGFQLQLAAGNGLDAQILADGNRLLDRLADEFAGHTPVASLLHGDLWGGNWGVTCDGIPVIYDPACYYGDREADLAMTRLFGGFGPEFYAAYNESWPLDDGFRRRSDLYNLYHVLNHFNLFGGGYRNQVAGLLTKLLH